MSNPSSPSKHSLSFTSQRASPFRRPDSPLGRSPSTVRAPTPQGSPLKQATPSHPPPADTRSTPTTDRSWIKQGSPAPSPSKSPIPFRLPSSEDVKPRGLPQPPAATTRPSAPVRSTTSTSLKGNNSDPLSSIPPQHLHTMRESFSVLDRSNSGQIAPGDVAVALAELGLDNSSSTLSTYFPPGVPALNLGAYLGLLTSDLAHLSRQDELMGAFGAFDDDDSGQIDVNELRDALLTTLPESGSPMTEEEVDEVLREFVGRRVLKKGQGSSGLGGKKEVFRYGDFSASIWGNGNGAQQNVSS
ncbi:hypothetical protein BT63DRAFT_410924 [Microthyrium microscopicum]|uniref:EF-hand domain-containing protein n=1 Tax=Microthyrium microscopicum TaxID=703497 RepID=A0A6A6USQ1_9PEZI|nr:hypothetical protein BT63DRAFT_410924 [Microthyrium microscopicum]